MTLDHVQPKFLSRTELESSVKIQQVVEQIVEFQSRIHDLRICDLNSRIQGSRIILVYVFLLLPCSSSSLIPHARCSSYFSCIPPLILAIDALLLSTFTVESDAKDFELDPS